MGNQATRLQHIMPFILHGRGMMTMISFLISAPQHTTKRRRADTTLVVDGPRLISDGKRERLQISIPFLPLTMRANSRRHLLRTLMVSVGIRIVVLTIVGERNRPRVSVNGDTGWRRDLLAYPMKKTKGGDVFYPRRMVPYIYLALLTTSSVINVFLYFPIWPHNLQLQL